MRGRAKALGDIKYQVLSPEPLDTNIIELA